MATINTNYQRLQSGYLFAEIARRTREFQNEYPDVTVMRLGIGNTTETLAPSIISGLKLGVEKLADVTTYTGYGDEQGDTRLRNALAQWYKEQGVAISPEEIFVSDGAKSDTANISSIFAADNIIAVQDPVYPVYVDSNVIAGRGGDFKNGRYQNIVYMDCTEENGFFPDLPKEHVDIIYICSPNNPTGSVATKFQLQQFIDYAIEHKAVIVYDAAYASFIKDTLLPRSIYEIEGAKTCAIEISSFSKWAGFTGVRLGWTVVPMEVVVANSKKGELNSLWNRRQCTMFNGASNIAQEGGLTVLTKKGQQECQKTIDYYMENACIIRESLEKLGITVFGGINMSSWDFFDKLLNEAHVVGTPGSGFGLKGEGYFRLSAFGHREQIQKAVDSIERNLQL
jgi:LL-diaminopimelate aminotransferase